MNKLVKAIEQKFMKKQVPKFRIGDTVRVETRIVEGDKERIQAFQGVVVGRSGKGLTETFRVNRVVFGYSNEKVFPVHGPSVAQIEVIRPGKVRKAKLNYIRGKIGKQAKITALIGGKEELYEASVDTEAEARAAREQALRENESDKA